MKMKSLVICFVLIGCGSPLEPVETAEALEPEDYPYPEKSFDPDEGTWSSSDYGSGGGYGESDAGLNCDTAPCARGACQQEEGLADYCMCEDGYGGERCDTCSAGYAAVGCDNCELDFECIEEEN
ncbi:MAG: hypothetical protein HOI23_22330 [Deltaproteobacteria bacterium]|jgi:hypothetical protein|nr:hypothetical protein [Deltaproteobacteria bacterium]MBT6431639.1 hypothetical protein [Deltaproteobacteria bacterium]